MSNNTVLISGAGIAGPALAYWLNKYGFSTTVVERAPALRRGGAAVDFRGDQLEVLRRMNLLEKIRALQTNMGEMVLLGRRGRALRMPSHFASGEVEILRGDLSELLFEATRDETEYVFGDSITALRETAHGVEVDFERGASRTFDLVVGADGQHSIVRALTFGPEDRFATFLGYYHAGFDVPNYLKLDRTSLQYNTPGRAADVASRPNPDIMGVGFLFAAPKLDYDRNDTAQQKQIITDRYAGMGWEVPRLLEELRRSDDLYFDSLSQITLDHFTQGRIALLGDAAWGAGPGGSGTGMAITGAYVLAGELAMANGDHAFAFAEYQRVLAQPAKAGRKQAKNTGPFLAPSSQFKIWHRNLIYRVLSSRLLAGFFEKLTTKTANAIQLKDYSAGRKLIGP